MPWNRETGEMFEYRKKQKGACARIGKQGASYKVFETRNIMENAIITYF